jgi:hypothetical protein
MCVIVFIDLSGMFLLHLHQKCVELVETCGFRLFTLEMDLISTG